MIQFFTEEIDFDVVLVSATKSWLVEVAKHQGHSISVLNYIFVSDEYLLSINRQYLQHDYYTDVITFDQRDDADASVEGDIFISVDRVSDNALAAHQDFFQELLRVMVHGLLHLLGYDDSDDELKLQMRCLEDKYVHLYMEQYS